MPDVGDDPSTLVTGAHLKFTIAQQTATGIAVYGVDPFTASTVTWNTAPANARTPDASKLLGRNPTNVDESVLGGTQSILAQR